MYHPVTHFFKNLLTHLPTHSLVYIYIYINPHKMLKKEKDVYLQACARDNAQLLVNQIFNLPVQRDEVVGAVVELPTPETPIPREKHVPEAKPLTKWEKFAKEKGIKKKKKDRKVYNEEKKDFVPAFGYKSKHDGHDWLIPVKEGVDDPYEDPFTKGKRLYFSMCLCAF